MRVTGATRIDSLSIVMPDFWMVLTVKVQPLPLPLESDLVEVTVTEPLLFVVAAALYGQPFTFFLELHWPLIVAEGMRAPVALLTTVIAYLQVYCRCSRTAGGTEGRENISTLLVARPSGIVTMPSARRLICKGTELRAVATRS